MLYKSMKPSFYILIFVVFIDFMGMGLVYPLYSKFLFDSKFTFLPFDMQPQIRGLWLGLLFALNPLVQFISSPICGTISDNKGRKKPLLVTLLLTVLGHIISIFGVVFTSLNLLILSRVVLGIGGGNISIVQASISDFSTRQDKAKNFGLYSMAIGLGFALGPFLGGSLSVFGYNIPFVFAALLTAVNLVLAYYFLKESNHKLVNRKISWSIGIKNLKKAFKYKNIRIIFICSFLCGFAWTYFLDFIPVYLMNRYYLSTMQIGIFYASIGLIYALSAGYLIRPLLLKYNAETLFFFSSLATAIALFTVPFYSSIFLLIPFIIFFSYVTAFLGPTSTSLVSNYASDDIQGEVLGVLGSINAASYGLSALLAGGLVGINLCMPMWLGGTVFLLSAVILYMNARKELFKRIHPFKH